MRYGRQQLMALCFREQSLCLVGPEGVLREEPLRILRLPGQTKVQAFGQAALSHPQALNPLGMTHGQSDLTQYFQWFLSPLGALPKLFLVVPIFHSEDTIHQGFWRQTFAPLKLKGLSLVSHLHCLKYLYAPQRIQGLAYFQNGLVETGINVKHELYATQVMGFGRFLNRALIRGIFEKHQILIDYQTSEVICQRLLNENPSPQEQLTVTGLSRRGRQKNHLVIFEELLPYLDRAMVPIWKEVQHLSELLDLWGASPHQDFDLYAAEILNYLQLKELGSVSLLLHPDDMIIRGIQQCLKMIQTQNLYTSYFSV